MRADGSGEAVRLTESKNPQTPCSFSPDGRWLAFHEQSSELDSDIRVLALDVSDPDRPRPGKPEAFLRTPAREENPAFSPDGRWLAYMSSESGRFEVYVRPFPGPGGKWQVSNGGGIYPVWSRNGKELFYGSTTSQERNILVVAYTTQGDFFNAAKPRVWLERAGSLPQPGRWFDPDG
jgi:serine/threonine-protein kinase